MKIGILTFQRAHNYGAVLQAYALKSTLENMGHEVKIVDYWPTYRKGAYKRFDFFFIRSLKMSFTERVQRMLLQPQRFVRYKRFEEFIHNYLNLNDNPQYLKPEHIQDDCDLYIYGSDQIWKYNSYPTLMGFDEVFWGVYPVTQNKKIAYAASMGLLRTGETESKSIQQHLQNFHSIGVREIQLQEMIQSLTEKSVVHVLDPVFLVPVEKWKSIAPKEKQIKNRYILFYHLLYSSDAVNKVSELAKKTGLDIVEINNGKLPLVFNKAARGIANGPLEFLDLIQNAEYVVSISFHGVAFSIIFEKQFYAFSVGNNAARAQSLLGALGIKDRLITDGDPIDIENRINYREVTSKLNLQRKQSIEFLRSAMLD